MLFQTLQRIPAIVKNIITIPIIQKDSFLKLLHIKTRTGTVAKKHTEGCPFFVSIMVYTKLFYTEAGIALVRCPYIA